MKQLSENELTRISKFTVTSADTDMYSRIQLGSYVNLLIQSSIHSADDMGHGFKDLVKRQLFWVLSRLTVDIYRPLEWHEELKVETWAKGLERLFYLRDYLVRDGNENIVGRGTSGWLAVDMETKRPKKIEGTGSDLFEYLKDKHAMKQLPESIGPVKEGKRFEVHSTYFDTDLNKHVTSTRYVDWMMDTFSPDFHRDHYPKRLSVNYIRETKPLETIHILRNQTGKKQYVFEGINVGADTIAFRGKIEF
ncbi:MAG: acyl-[acyl-carrier-protein] thioesterase [Bacteroidales bacterium]